jgi:hypothetical protein
MIPPEKSQSPDPIKIHHKNTAQSFTVYVQRATSKREPQEKQRTEKQKAEK